jgi:hypothetical protein
MSQITIILLLSVLVIVLLSFIFFTRSQKSLIPWTRTSLQNVKRFIHMNPVIINSWESMSGFYTFPIEKKLIVTMKSRMPRPNMVMCVGTSSEYDKFLVLRVRKLADDVYLLDVDYLGPGSSRSGLELKVTF